MLLEVGKLRHGWGLGGTWPPSPPTAHWLPLRAGTGSWEPLCWGTQSRAGAEPQSAARCPGAPKFKGRSLKSRICCSQAQGAASTPHTLLGGCWGAGWGCPVPPALGPVALPAPTGAGAGTTTRVAAGEGAAGAAGPFIPAIPAPRPVCGVSLGLAGPPGAGWGVTLT